MAGRPWTTSGSIEMRSSRDMVEDYRAAASRPTERRTYDDRFQQLRSGSRRPAPVAEAADDAGAGQHAPVTPEAGFGTPNRTRQRRGRSGRSQRRWVSGDTLDEVRPTNFSDRRRGERGADGGCRLCPRHDNGLTRAAGAAREERVDVMATPCAPHVVRQVHLADLNGVPHRLTSLASFCSLMFIRNHGRRRRVFRRRTRILTCRSGPCRAVARSREVRVGEYISVIRSQEAR